MSGNSTEVPAAPAPAGMTSNLVNPYTLAPALISTIVILFFIVTVLAILRVVAITKLKRPFWWDDGAFFVAYIAAFARNIIIGIMAKYFRHDWDLPKWLTDGEYLRKLEFSSVMTYETAIFLSKISILLLYVRIFRVQRLTLASIIFTMVYATFIYGLVIGTNCYFRTPGIGKDWETKNFTRYNSVKPFFTRAYGFFILSLDVLIFIIPIPAVLKIQTSLSIKLRALAMFFLGLLAVMAASASAYIRVSNDYKNQGAWSGGLINLCATLELHISMIISCAAAAKMVFRKESLHILRYGSHKLSSPENVEIGHNLHKADDAEELTTHFSAYDSRRDAASVGSETKKETISAEHVAP